MAGNVVLRTRDGITEPREEMKKILELLAMKFEQPTRERNPQLVKIIASVSKHDPRLWLVATKRRPQLDKWRSEYFSKAFTVSESSGFDEFNCTFVALGCKRVREVPDDDDLRRRVQLNQDYPEPAQVLSICNMWIYDS